MASRKKISAVVESGIPVQQSPGFQSQQQPQVSQTQPQEPTNPPISSSQPINNQDQIAQTDLNKVTPDVPTQNVNLGIAVQQSPQSINSLPESSSYVEPQRKGKLWIIVIVVVIIVVLIGAALFYFRTKAIKEIAKQEKAAPTSSVFQKSISPKPSIASEASALKIDFSKYKVQVLNGSGIKGEAAKVKGILEGEKLNVQDIGNADDTNYEKTIIKAKKEVAKDFLDKLKSILEKTYILDSSVELKDSEKFDVIVVIGSKTQK